jgi:CRISPR-associated endonuclease/helicase Cas3
MLILLDEVHLSQPFKQTLERLGSLRERFTHNGLPRRFQFAFLSATPGEVSDQKFELTPAELDARSPLGPRLHARKLVRIVEASGREELAKRVAKEIRTLGEKHRVMAAVVNRVDTALAIFATLKADSRETEDIVLLTGRMRPLDRDDVLATYRSRIATGARSRTVDEGRLIVVGTQCIEAGADFDFDAIVSESASFDGLRQRFGRVDRLGEYKDEEGDGNAEGVIVHDKSVKDDPIYGETISKTVKWLTTKLDGKRKIVDFGSRSLLDAPVELLAPKADAPILLPSYFDLWCQTAPEPFVVPEPGLFLHGPRSGPEDVQVIWRTDLDATALAYQAVPNIVAAVGAVRPSSLEALSLPFVTACRWLRALGGEALEGATDLEVKADDNSEPSSGGRRALRWHGDQSEMVDASNVRPGDTLVVPSSYGGIDPASKCFDPSAKVHVTDLAERASVMARGRPLLRLHPRVLEGLGLSLDTEEPEAARDELARLADTLTGWERPWAAWLGAGRRVQPVPWGGDGDDGGWVVLSGRRVKAKELRAALTAEEFERDSVEEGSELTTDDEDSPYVGSEVTLNDHSEHVEKRARDYSRRLGLSDKLINDLALAAWLHDIGKADRRFQLMLRGGSEIAYYRDEHRVLAKSAIAASSKSQHQRARRTSGYPKGARHEVQSVAMIQLGREQIEKKTYDFDLVAHLVASHHGYCRPFAPAIEDCEPVEVALSDHRSQAFGSIAFGKTTSAHGLHRLDSPLADRFWSLVAKYGWLELCWLEAILRLADHRASEDEAGDRT